jgi:MFS family permease
MAVPESAVGKYFSGLSRSTVLLALTSLCADTSTELLYPVLPVFLTQVLAASGSVVGVIEGAAEATQNIVQGASGWLSDRMRARKSIAIAGYALAALAKPLIGLSTTWSGVLGARLLDRFGTGTRSAPRDALVAGSVSDAYRGRAFGLEGAGDNFGAFLGPVLAALLLSAFRVDIRTIFFIALIPGAATVGLMSLVREPRSQTASTTPKATVHLGQLPASYWKYLLAVAVFSIGNSSNAFLILETKAAGASLTLTILIYAGFNLVAALASYPAGAISDRFGRTHVLTASFAVFLVTYVGFALAHRVALLGGLFLFYGLYQGLFRAVGKALASDLVPGRLRATGLGLYSTTIGLSGLFASVAAGQLWDRVGPASVFWYGAATAVAGAIALQSLVPDHRRAHPGASGTSTRPISPSTVTE